MNKELLIGLIGIFSGFFLALLLTSTAINSNNFAMMNMMGINPQSQRLSQPTTDTFDKLFLEQMVPHHEDAITMAKIALEKTTRPEIKTLAQGIIASQDSEIQKMKAWYKAWYGQDLSSQLLTMNVHKMTSVTGGMHMGMMGDSTDITRLQESPDIDKAFIEQMIPHHQMAIMMAAMLKKSTNRPEMAVLSEDIINAQSKEIDDMRGWYQTWYL